MNLNNSSLAPAGGVVRMNRCAILLVTITIVVWRPGVADADAGIELQPRVILTAHEEPVKVVAFSPDGLSLATGGKDERLLVWDLKTARYAQRYDHDSEITQLHWAPDGQMLTARGLYNAPVFIKPGAFPTPLSDGYTYTINSTFNRAGTIMALSASLGSPFDKESKYGLVFWKLPDMEKTELEINPDRGVREIDFSPDGSLIAGAYEKKAGADIEQAVVTIWDAASGKVVTSFSGKPYPSLTWFHTLVRFSPDGKSLLYRKTDVSFAVWDLAGKKDRVEFTPAKSSKVVACSPDARWLAVVEDNNKVVVWDSASGKLAFTLRGAPALIEALDISSSGLLAAGAGSSACIWALPGAGTGAALPPVTQPAGAPVAVAPDGGPFASAEVTAPATKPATVPAGEDAPPRPLFDAPQVRPVRAIRGRGGRIIAFALTSDGRAIATSQFMDDARVYDLATGQDLPAPEGFWGATRFCITDDRQHLIGTGDQGLWMRHAKNMHWRNVKNTETVNALRFDPATGQFLAGGSDGQVTSWKLAPAAEEGDALLATLKGGRNIRELALSSDGKYVAAAGFTGRANARDEYTLALTVWDRRTGVIVASADGGTVGSDEASSLTLPVAFANDNRTILYRYNDRDFVAWDWQGPAHIRTISLPIPMSLAAFSPDGKMLVSLALRDQEPETVPAVHVWDSATGKLLWNLTGIAPRAEVACIGFSPDGKTIVANSGKTMVMWAIPAQAAPK